MSMREWAEMECRKVCKEIDPNFDFDGDDFDYDCSCYKSALKAYKSLMEDGHSGSSFGFTKNILIRLMEGQPLTPITDKDFFDKNGKSFPIESDEYLKERGLKSEIQCPRMSSLFRMETLDGKVTYHDIDRCVMIDAENPSECHGSGDDRIIDEMFPITMPYMPERGKYKIYTQTFYLKVRLNVIRANCPNCANSLTSPKITSTTPLVCHKSCARGTFAD